MSHVPFVATRHSKTIPELTAAEYESQRTQIEQTYQADIHTALSEQMTASLAAIQDGATTYTITAEQSEALAVVLASGMDESGLLGALAALVTVADAGVVMDTIDYAVIENSAAAAARSYSYDLVKDINATSAKRLQNVIGSWLEQPERTIDELIEAIEPIFGSARSENIAVTEVTRAIATGKDVAWAELNKQYGEDVVIGRRWLTANDDRVCGICAPLGGLVFSTGPQPASRVDQMMDAIVSPLFALFVHPGGGGNAANYAGEEYEQPAHPRCRCDYQPVFADWVTA